MTPEEAEALLKVIGKHVWFSEVYQQWVFSDNAPRFVPSPRYRLDATSKEEALEEAVLRLGEFDEYI